MEINNSNPRSSEDFDWRMIKGQNPIAPSSSSANGGSVVQHPSFTTAGMGNGGFVVDNGGSFPFKEQQRLPAMGMRSSVNPVRSILGYSDRFSPFSPLSPDPFTPYSDELHCNGNVNHMINPGLAGFDPRSSLSGFLETLNDRTLEFNFNRLSISTPNHNPRPYPANNFLTTVSAPAPVNRNPRCNGVCCHPQRDNGFVQRSFGSNFLDSHAHSRQQPKRNKFPASLKEIRGKIRAVAKDQEGCQFLQTKCEEGKPEDIEMIFNEIKDHIYELMTDASMNYLAQKLFKACNERQMTHIVVYVISDDTNLTNICLNSHGTRAMQKLIELLKTSELRSLMVSALRRITLTLTKNTNGHHVIQHCLKTFHVDEVKPILNVVADNCLDIATDKSGCCVLQLCVLHADERSKDRLMSDIIENALDLSEHPYGNYVVQHILGMQIADVTAHIVKNLAGNFVHLAMNKYASNVVEKCLKDSHDDQSTPIIREIIQSPNFLGLIQHPFGNYVAQSVLLTAKGPLRELMISKVQKEYAYLHSPSTWEEGSSIGSKQQAERVYDGHCMSKLLCH